MPNGKVVGVLVGEHKHGLGGLPLHCAHYVDTETFDDKNPGGPHQTRLRAGGKPDRKGYKTFRCGDMVQSTEAETLGMVAVVVGVAMGQVRTQQRRVLLLCEMDVSAGVQAACAFF
eukprot:3260185-Pleurochrysis_carterae.AAC.1